MPNSATFLAILLPFLLTMDDGVNKTLRAKSVQRAETMAKDVTISRDEFGVPHVRAKTDAGAVFGGMYARAEDEMLRIEQAYSMLTARASLFFGPTYVPWDRLVLAYELPTRSKEAVDKVPADVRALLVAGADALNFYQKQHPEYKPWAIDLWEPWMLLCGDYAWGLHMAQQEIQRLIAEEKKPGGQSSIDGGSSQVVSLFCDCDGSNAWAIAPSRTKSAKAMLYINPHIPLDEPYELHLRSDEGLNISGLVAYGSGLLPFAGYNDRLGWTLTVNYVDIADSYAVEFNVPNNPIGYKFGDKVLQATTIQSEIQVRTSRGVEAQTARFVKTHHGPLVHQSGSKSIAVRFAGAEKPRALEQWYRMAKAKNLAEWKAAVSTFGVVFHNFVYADAEGNIGYIYNAAFPKRDESFDWSGTVDGSNPKTEWQGYHKLSDLIQVWNPSCGYVQNCNSPPFMTCPSGQNPDRAKYPKSMIGKDLVDGRVAMSHKILGAAKGWTLDDLEHAAFDPTAHGMESSRKALLADFDKYKAIGAQSAKKIEPAIQVIREWNGRLDVDSVAATLFSLWIEKVFSPTWVKRRAPGDLSAGLGEVVTDLERTFKTWEVKWGDINRHQRFDHCANVLCSDARESLPVAAGHAGMGVSFCFLSRTSNTKLRYGFHGHSYVGAVEFGEHVAARTVIPFGESRHSESPHYNDQAKLYVNGKMKAARFTDAQVDAGAKRAYHPGE